ncbi:helix-turn-helix domain-containing protein [Streptomyces sp. S.PB5]|uniref:TetR/AcrR family transcriptional regulator n=1 Tax=Streptomyces sp. S.PB5 TaxID=3020844 RepID=UPI0025AFB881|nr:helix-turn-helix domain-containing protein [Streptomyces sp. S.PB5]MDN3029661.1 helix-turn-helix domain containing protein [Streptomyces sp. S.PB5]
MTAQDRARADLLPGASTRPARKDAARNHDAIVVAAREEFAEHGDDASLKAIARRAGVGIATLYRHFPSRAALLETVYADDVVDTVDALCRTAGDGPAVRTAAGGAPQPWAALVGWLGQLAGAVAEDAALRGTFTDRPCTLEPCRAALGDTVARLLTDAGVRLPSRQGMDADQLLRTVVTVAVSPFLSEAERARALAVLLDGVQAGAGPG